jgi:tetratricopeptide (TPR) repeat protein
VTEGAKESAFDGAAEDFSDAIEHLFQGERDEALATAIVSVAAIATGSPWWVLAKPVLSRALGRLANRAGNAAIAAVAKELEDEAALQRVIQKTQASTDRALTELLRSLARRERELSAELGDAVASASDDTVSRLALLIHHTEERLALRLSPHAELWRALSPGTRARGDRMLPSALLVAAHQAVPYIGREALFEKLAAWADHPAPARLALLTGRGGSGKTRFAIELGARFRARGVPAGFVFGATTEPALSGSEPRVLVVDYAEGKAELLADLLRRLAAGHAPKTRVVLLARERGEWWDALTRLPETNATLIHEALRVGLDQDDLGVLSPSECQAVWTAGLAVFRGEAASRADPRPPDFTAASLARPLPILMHALVAQHEAAPASEPELLSRVLDHEWRHHEQALARLGLAQWEQRTVSDVSRRLLTIATLLGGIARDRLIPAATEMLTAGLGHPPGALAREVVTLLGGLHPAPSGVGQLEPDILGEQLLEQVTAEHPDLIAEAANLATTDAERRSLLTVLARHARRTRDETRLERLFAHDLEAFASIVLGVCVEGAAGKDPVAEALLGHLELHADDVGVVALSIADRCPQLTVSLPRVAVTATRIALTHAQEKLTAENSESRLAEVARLANNLALRLSNVGRREDALTIASQAVEAYDRLAAANPRAFAGAFAASLNNLATFMKAVGRPDDALATASQVVEAYRILVAANLDAFVPNLAAALSNLATMLDAVGRPEEALVVASEAVELGRKLAEANPNAFVPELATSLHTLAISLRAVGRLEDALAMTRDAVDAYRALAKASPDTFMPNLAASLTSLANSLNSLGRREDALAVALEAVETYRILSEASSDAFVEALARSLGTLGRVHRTSGDPAAAAAAFGEAKRTLLRAFDTFPEAFAQLMHTLQTDYLGACAAAGLEPDQPEPPLVDAVD